MKNPLAILPQRSRLGISNIARAMAEMEHEMDRMIKSSLRTPAGVESIGFAPICNIKENDKEYIVQFDIPGVKKDEIKIQLADNRITVSGERKEQKEEKDVRHFLSETYYGSFMRSFDLPREADESKVDALCEDGVLTIKIKKNVALKSKEIKIH